MPDETHVLESLPAYALGSLDDAQARRVAEHVAGCSLCQSELSAFQAVVEQLALPLKSAAPPDDVRRRLMERARAQAEPRRPAPPVRPAAARGTWVQRLLPVWAVVSLLLILGLGVANLRLWQRFNDLEALTGPTGMRALALRSTEAAPQASGFVVVSADGQNGALVVDKMPRLAPEQQYQLWLVRGAHSTSGAVFSVDESGYGGVRIRAPESLLTYAAVRITVEPDGGSACPTGEPILDGLLQNP